jgi:DnaJ-domain-containing protein 1
MENNMNESSQFGVTGITEKLKHSIASIMQSSQELREALITRDVERIWQLLALQEEQMRELDQHNTLWCQLFGELGNIDPTVEEIKKELKSDIRKLRNLEQCNGYLSKSYLNAIKRAMKNTGSKLATKTNIYGRRGRMKMKKSSIMINSIG